MLANPPQSRSANGLNQYLAINNNAITHDANGNLQSDGLWAYGHDLDNRLVSAVRNNPASDVSLGYDPAGRLSRTVVDSQITDLLYDGTDLIAEYAGAGNLTTRHIHGPGVDAPLVSMTGTTKTWRYADHLGSVIAEADAAGNAVAIRGYGPFGENGSTAPNRFGYTGQQYIAGLGLYYYKARWYSPTMGRFLETDPIGYGDGVNWYAYVGNNPVNWSDPRGLSASDAAMLSSSASESGSQLDWSKGVQVAVLPLLPLLGFGLIANEIATSDVPIIGGGVAKGAIAGGGARLENLGASEITRIQNAANRSGQEISVVGSRAGGTTRSASDWDYVIDANAKTRNSLSTSLPGAGNTAEGIRPNLDVFKGRVDETRPFIRFFPE